MTAIEVAIGGTSACIAAYTGALLVGQATLTAVGIVILAAALFGTVWFAARLWGFA